MAEDDSVESVWKGLRFADSTAFHNWFDGSVAADMNGCAQTYYHGSIVFANGVGNIQQFNPRASVDLVRRTEGLDAIGVWCSDNPDHDGAGLYAGVQQSGEQCAEGGVIYPVYLSIRNPLLLDSFQELREWWADYHCGRHPRAVTERHRLNPHYGDAAGFVDYLRKQDYDGLRIAAHSSDRSTEFADQQCLVAFDGSQVVMAVPNRECAQELCRIGGGMTYDTENSLAECRRFLEDNQVTQWRLSREMAGASREWRGTVQFVSEHHLVQSVGMGLSVVHERMRSQLIVEGAYLHAKRHKGVMAMEVVTKSHGPGERGRGE